MAVSNPTLVDKLRFCAWEIGIAQHVVSCALNEDDKRLLSRYLFIRLDSWIELARRLNNQNYSESHINKTRRDAIKSSINQLSSDYQELFAVIRDKLTAHQQVIDYLGLLESWNDINLLGVEVLSSQALDLTRMLLAPHAPLLEHELPKVGIEQVSSLRDGPVATSLPLGLTRDQNAATIPLNPTQAKLGRTLEVIDFIERLIILIPHIRDIIFFTLIDALILVDALSLLDSLYEDADEDSVLTIFTEEGADPNRHLLNSHTSRDLAYEEELRTIRNHFFAHLDVSANMTLLDLQQEAKSGFDQEKLLMYLDPHIAAYRLACNDDVRFRHFRFARVPLRGVHEVSPGAQAPFDEYAEQK